MTNRMLCFSCVPLAATDRELGRILKSYFGRLDLTSTQIQRVCAIARVAPATMLRAMGHAADVTAVSDEYTAVSHRCSAST
jgi:hypothetical protein